MVNDKDLLSFDYKKDFPLLAANDVAYLDNSATTQKPACVIEAERDFYLKHNGIEQCGKYLKNLIGVYRILLYDKMKYGNIAELKEKLNDSEQKKLKSLFKNYGRLTYFAEAMLENNVRFFAETEKAFELNRLIGRDYIKNFFS